MDKNEKVSIEFTKESFDHAYSQNSFITDKKKNLNKIIKEQSDLVDELDRYDDFASLKINAQNYLKKHNCDYGIEYNPDIHINRESIILPPQQVAARRFLKEHRGFGLLADIVGSGKTFEAAMILSELATRNLIRSLLIIVPNEVIQDWKDVLENKFGLGKNVIITIPKNDIEKNDNVEFNKILSNVSYTTETINNKEYFIYRKPIMIASEVFSQLSIGQMDRLLFDAIVYDEAHNLCGETRAAKYSLKLLSSLMIAKRLAKKPYCILLSATPHSGNLANMFLLWYFIRSQGGNPSDFEEKDEKYYSKMYFDERETYNRVCRKAITIREFMQNVRVQKVLKNENIRTCFEEYLKKEQSNINNIDLSKNYEIGSNEFLILRKLVNAFFENRDYLNVDQRQKIEKEIAKTYHWEVLRTIMIRQPYDEVKKYLFNKNRSNINIFFFPTKNKQIKFTNLNNEYVIDISKINSKNVITKLNGGQTYSIEEYFNEYYKRVDIEESDLTNADILLNAFFGKDDYNDELFIKTNSHSFYDEMVRINSDTENLKIEIIPSIISNNEDYDNILYEDKLKKLESILNKHSNKRVIIFYDYDIKNSIDKIGDKLEESLKNKYSQRLIVGNKENVEYVKNIFDEKDDCILLVKNIGLTESTNFQKCNIVVNFQVTSDPVAMDQRLGRVVRIGQKNNVIIYSLADMSKLEGYMLAYYMKIGLMYSNKGDTTIIAGSNNDRMIAVRCKVCGSTKLFDKEEYDLLKSSIGKENEYTDLYCDKTEECINLSKDRKGTLMTEIASASFKCIECGYEFNRVNDSSKYLCNEGHTVMSGTSDNSRRIHCDKICIALHCKKLINNKCGVLQYYSNKQDLFDPNQAAAICKICTANCDDKCKFYLKEKVSNIENIQDKLVNNCIECRNRSLYGNNFTCRLGPHSLAFNDKWEADCPECGRKNSLKQLKAKSFSNYINGAWNFNKNKKDESFCDLLRKEVKKVMEITEILKLDEEEQ